MSALAGRRVAVTGGTGFIGRALVRHLLAQGCRVRILTRQADWLSPEVEVIRGDVRSLETVSRLADGVDVLFHLAAKSGSAGSRRQFEAINVGGTVNAISAAKRRDVALIYTSTPSVVCGRESLDGADETTPYPDRYVSAYAATKAVAERHITFAAQAGLSAVSLRPHLVWGVGDPHFLPALIRRARRRVIALPVNSEATIDPTHVDDAALAHVRAAERLMAGPLPVSVFFITGAERILTVDMIMRLLRVVALEPRLFAVPLWLARAVAVVAETAALVGLDTGISRMTVNRMAHTHVFSIGAAREHLGYEPTVSIDEGLRLLGLDWAGRATEARAW